jgi:hypothetical protein
MGLDKMVYSQAAVPSVEAEDGVAPETMTRESSAGEKDKDTEGSSVPELSHSNKGDELEGEIQDGVRQAEAITANWSKNSLRTAYLL